MSTDKSHISAALWFSILIPSATALRIFQLGRRSLWLDESVSSMIARTDWHTFVTVLSRREANMALYYLLLRGWIHLGHTEASMRTLSVVFGVAAIPIMYQLVRATLGPEPARIATFLMAIHVLHIRYSQEARGYALVVLLALLSCYYFLQMRTSATRRMQAAYILASILMVYAHVFGVWILLAQWACEPLLQRTARKTVRIAAGIICIAISPLAVSLLFVSDRSQLSWMNQSTAPSFWGVLLDLSGNGGSPILALYLVLLFVSLRSLLRAPQRPMRGTLIVYVFLWVWLLLPTFSVAIISQYRPILQTRYLIVCLPAFLILAADGLVHIRSKPIFVAALVAIVGMSLVGLNSYYEARADLSHSDNWRDATGYCLAQARNGDAVLFTYSAEEIPFREYQDQLRGNLDITLVPKRTELDLLSTAGTWASPALAASTATQNHRVWVITALQPNAHTSEVQAALRTQLEAESQRSFGFVTTQLFVAANSDGLPAKPQANQEKHRTD